VTDSSSGARDPFWSPDGRYLYYIFNGDIWQQRMHADFSPEGPPQAVTTGLDIWSAAFSRDGAKLAYSKVQFAANLWSVPVPGSQDPPKTWADARQVTFDQAWIGYVDVSPDGQRLLFDSDRTGNWEVWMKSLLGDTLWQLTTDPAMDLHGMWSPNGQEIAFHSTRSGNRDIWVMPASGGPARQLTQHQAEDMQPQWSPDGQEIAFGSHRSGNWDIWVIPSTGGEARQVTSHPADDETPQWSPDGNWLVFQSNRESELPRLWRVPAGGGQPELLTKENGVAPYWPRHGKRIYFKKRIEGTLTLWELSLENGRERQVLDLQGRPGGLHPNTLGTDGKRLFFTWSESVADIWMMDVEKKD
jgi:TolB protein